AGRRRLACGTSRHPACDVSLVAGGRSSATPCSQELAPPNVWAIALPYAKSPLARTRSCGRCLKQMKNCPHCRLRVRLSQRERMGNKAGASHCVRERFLLPRGEG